MYNRFFAFDRLKQKWKQNSSTASPTSSTTWRSAPPSCGGIFDYDHKRERLTLLNQEMEDPKIWDDPKRAQELGKEKKALEDIVLVLEAVDNGVKSVVRYSAACSKCCSTASPRRSRT